MDEKLTFKDRFSYSITNLGIVLVWTSISSFIMIFYTDIALLPTAAIGIFILASRILDGVTEFFQGIWIERGRNPKGKYRVWLFRMAIPFGAAAVLCFSAFPQWPVAIRIAYAVVTYNILNTFIYSMLDMSYNSLSAAMTQNQHERSMLNLFRLFMATVGGLIVNIAVPAITSALGGGPAAWQVTFVIFGVISALLIYFTYFNTKERVTAVNETEKLPVKTAFKSLFGNKYWVMIICYSILSYTSSGTGGIGVFFFREILGDFALIGLITIIGVIPMLLGAFVMAPIVKRKGKRVTALIGICTSIFGSLLVAFLGATLPIVLIATVFRAFGGACIIGTLFAMINDTVEYGEWKTGVRTTALVSTASAFGANIGNGIGMAIVAFALTIGGYVARDVFHDGPTGQSEAALSAISFVFIWIPIILLVGMAVILCFYNLDKEYPKILEELKARKAAQEDSEEEPVSEMEG